MFLKRFTQCNPCMRYLRVHFSATHSRTYIHATWLGNQLQTLPTALYDSLSLNTGGILSQLTIKRGGIQIDSLDLSDYIFLYR